MRWKLYKNIRVLTHKFAILDLSGLTIYLRLAVSFSGSALVFGGVILV
jgi:hypothetical protein